LRIKKKRKGKIWDGKRGVGERENARREGPVDRGKE
jgi:hypothetical protein